jgi:hypothetical protein
MRIQGLGARLVLGTDINAHLGARGWYRPACAKILLAESLFSAECLPS